VGTGPYIVVDAVTDEFHDPASYGALLADEYDAIYGDVFDTEAAVDQLTRLASGGRVLEFGVGTGRIALPLAGRGLDVWGVDGSSEMLTILNGKPGADRVTTLCGDFATTTAEGKFDLVVLLINTIYAWARSRVRSNASRTQHGIWLLAGALSSRRGFPIRPRGVLWA
jgi:SAM-dependent methyltransferase